MLLALGICYFANGDRYEGEWSNDTINGTGKFFSNSQARTTMRAGISTRESGVTVASTGKVEDTTTIGVLYYANGEKYDGEWDGGSICGKGVFYFASGEKYDGEWRENKESGKGSF